MTKMISRHGQKEFECELKGLIFPCESKEEYEWICSIQTKEKIGTYTSGTPTGNPAKEIKLQKRLTHCRKKLNVECWDLQLLIVREQRQC